jgi:acyl-CoA thioesterase I
MPVQLPPARIALLLTPIVAILALGVITARPIEQTPSGDIRIMPLGDSITQGNATHISYRRGLWLRLRQAGYAVDFVGSTQEQFGGTILPGDFDRDHEGHWGWRTDEVLPQIEAWSRKAQPDIVLVHLGTNDLAKYPSVNSIDSTVAELRSLIQTLRRVNPRVKVLLAQIIPLWGSEEKFRQFNRQVEQLAQQMSTPESRVMAVDQFTDFDPMTGKDTYDGCHPSSSGEAKMVDRWFAALKQVLPQASPPRKTAPDR